MMAYGIIRKNLMLLLLPWLFSCSGVQALIPIPPPPYSNNQAQNYLTKAWAGFKANFILTNGRVVRIEDNNDTVSEGQAYGMLFSVYMNDKKTFDKCFLWTEQNLSRTLPGALPYGGPDNLLAWRWIPSVGVQGGNWEPATDADQDYAYALLLAYEKWGQANYLSKALAVLQDILAKETYVPALPLSDTLLFLKPGTWGDANLYGHQGIFFNPSYLSPAWYRKFNEYLPDNRWQKLINGTYHILDVAATSILNPATGTPSLGVGPLPDWAFIDDLGIVYFQGDNASNPSLTISSWDAFRLPWRIFYDWKVTHESEVNAGNYLSLLQSFYQNEFNNGQKIYASYYYTGAPAVNYTSPAGSGIPLLACSLDPNTPLLQQNATAQTALAYILKSAPVNPPLNNQYSGPDTFQETNKQGVFVAPGDTLRYYINSWGILGLVIATLTP